VFEEVPTVNICRHGDPLVADVDDRRQPASKPQLDGQHDDYTNKTWVASSKFPKEQKPVGILAPQKRAVAARGT
jgi:hypothetical protein